jgi:DNA-binding NarL/FixJ family response regulator
MGRGLSDTGLATELTLSAATVTSHAARIFAKPSLRDRAQAVVLAYETGLVAPRRGAGNRAIGPHGAADA